MIQSALIERQGATLKTTLPLLFLVVILSACSSTTIPATPTSTPQESAWTACTLFVERQLGIPFTDAQEYNPAGVTDLGGGGYQVEVFYAGTGDTYRCELLKRTDGDWQLEGLEAR